MKDHLGFEILCAAANVLVVLLVAPLFEGLLRKVTARIQSRQGPPLVQPYLDIFKLLGKEDIESGVVPGVQRFAAYLSLAAILTVSTMVPIGTEPPMGGSADVILLIYLLTLCGVSTLLAGLSAGSTYSLMGVSREMMAMMTLEPLLAIALLAGAVHADSFRLDVLLDGSAYAQGGFPWSGLILLGTVLFSLQGFVSRVPFDMAEAETEIMEGALIEYSGPKLALFKLARSARLFVYSALFVSLFIPWGSALPYPISLLLLLAKVLVLVLLVTVVAATHARYRIDQAIRYYAGLFGVSVLALVLALYGY